MKRNCAAGSCHELQVDKCGKSLVPSRVAFEPLALGLVDSLKALSFLYMVRGNYSLCPLAAQQNFVARQQTFKDNQKRDK